MVPTEPAARRAPSHCARRLLDLTLLALVVLALGSLALGCAACRPTPPGEASASARRTVAASVAPHGWLVEVIAGDAIDVVTILPPTADPHTHLPTDAEATRLAGSTLLFRSGVPFENGAWFRALISRGERRSTPLTSVDLLEGVELLAEPHSSPHHDGQHHDGQHHGGQHHGGMDPHVWLSPRRLATQARTVAAALAERFPEDAGGFRARAESLATRLELLDAELTQRLAPYRGRSFLVLHPSWSYFADDYGLEQLAVEAGGSAPSDAELTTLLRRARQEDLRTVFVQPQSAATVPAVLAAELGAEVQILDPLVADVEANLRHVADRLVASFRTSAANSGTDEP